MAVLPIKTTRRAVPMIYAYSTPEIARHDGWIKIGYTEQTVEERIKQQTHTSDVRYKEEWRGAAIYDDGSGMTFRDTDFHVYLRKLAVEFQAGTEWFQISGPESQRLFQEFRVNHGRVESPKKGVPYSLRDEQADAVQKTLEYWKTHPQGEFLWNAKPRFGKTLATYDFIQQIGAVQVLIVTNRPAIANSWYDDYEKFFGTQSNYRFVSDTDSLRGKMLVRKREDFVDELSKRQEDDEELCCITFLSLQDLKGSRYFGGQHDKLKYIWELPWDLMVVDEAHEGVDTSKTITAFDNVQRNFTLHLSGTPFKALANEKFPADAIYNWTYKDEQTARRDWDEERGTNPYETLPRLNLFTYQMSEIVRDELEQGLEIDGQTQAYAFDLNEFFRVEGGKFVHESSVDQFLEALTTQEKYPFSTPELRDELKHTFWLLNRIASARLLAKKLEAHPIFGEYKIVLAVGNGQPDELNSGNAPENEVENETKNTEANRNSFNKVKKAIEDYDKTITLSVGQLTTGVTIPEWTAVLMLSSMKSPSLYMQAAFRSQNPCLFCEDGGSYHRKENAYVFDFDPARTLEIFEQFANDLSSDTTRGQGDSETRKAKVRELLNFFPVIGEDENGVMVALDAEKVLSIPRKIRSQEVVRRGFMSNFLFQNIGTVFHAPPEVMGIINHLDAWKEPTKRVDVTAQTVEELALDENGEVNLDSDWVIGQANTLFGPKIYADCSDEVQKELETVLTSADLQGKKPLEHISKAAKETYTKKLVEPMLDEASEHYGAKMTKSDRRQLENKLGEEIKRQTEKALHPFKTEQEELNPEKLEEVFLETAQTLAQTVAKEIVQTVETGVRQREKEDLETRICDHLRGFTRTIPSFLMAYGDETVTLATFDTIIPEDVFEEVTSITLEQFRFLRDGGLYTDTTVDPPEEKHFAGQLFDSIVFDDSVQEFMRLKRTLANYFDEQSTGDIFDYIPPQKTNQIFTPKKLVCQMVDWLEAENPGCFDDPDKTFIDLYMKSGLYVAEIVKRLYRSPAMQKHFPNAEKRLKHIFEHQVYGLAPTEIIYNIAVNFILGFTEQGSTFAHHFRYADALPAAKEGKLEDLLDHVFGE